MKPIILRFISKVILEGHLLWPRGHSNTPNPVLNGVPPHRDRHQGIVVNLYCIYMCLFCICVFVYRNSIVADLNSPDKDRGVPAPSDNHRTVGSYINSSDFSPMTVATRKQKFTRAGAPSTQATIPRIMM